MSHILDARSKYSRNLGQRTSPQALVSVPLRTHISTGNGVTCKRIACTMKSVVLRKSSCWNCRWTFCLSASGTRLSAHLDG